MGRNSDLNISEVQALDERVATPQEVRFFYISDNVWKTVVAG
jgi:hypothetical protein